MGKAPVTKACSTRECCLLQLFLIPVYITHWQIAGAEQNETPAAGQGFHVDGGWGRFWGWECTAVIEQ
jgi:hypothetical protein